MEKLKEISFAFVTGAGLFACAGAVSAHPDRAAPLNNPGSWVNVQDYPAEALRNEEEGITRFTLRIAPDGSVSACNVTQGSGSAALDAKTCEILLVRARFRPATDPSGKPVEGVWSSSVRWMIPEDAPPLPPPPSGEVI
ncbi:MAG: energy transducer TonB [Novosphingobium sp.]|uniref:energy transducer TonB n=1 Tax=Novosphingobium sp. TaxID=1874826 RepID=UPI0032B705B1